MYATCGYQWASMILFFMALACCGIPFLFWVYGARIRAKSKYAYAGDDDDETSTVPSTGVSDEENQIKKEGREQQSAPAPPLAAGPAP